MNRDETADVLRIRLTRTGDNFAQTMLDEWATSLGDVDKGAAVVAMRRACDKHARVGWYQFHEELVAHLRARVDRNAEAAGFDCMFCGGTGWKDAGTDRRGNSSSEPCTSHVKPSNRICTPEEGLMIAAVACETEMRRLGKPSHEIDDALARHFGIGIRT